MIGALKRTVKKKIPLPRRVALAGGQRTADLAKVGTGRPIRAVPGIAGIQPGGSRDLPSLGGVRRPSKPVTFKINGDGRNGWDQRKLVGPLKNSHSVL